jgi:hypothetical protein
MLISDIGHHFARGGKSTILIAPKPRRLQLCPSGHLHETAWENNINVQMLASSSQLSAPMMSNFFFVPTNVDHRPQNPDPFQEQRPQLNEKISLFSNGIAKSI